MNFQACHEEAPLHLSPREISVLVHLSDLQPLAVEQMRAFGVQLALSTDAHVLRERGCCPNAHTRIASELSKPQSFIYMPICTLSLISLQQRKANRM
jgi:hypothetical protein